MTIPTFVAQRDAWLRVPIDDQGYEDVGELIALRDYALKAITAGMRDRRYMGWRNHRNLWRDTLKLDVKTGHVLDYGCGFGLEALELARAGNAVSIADINSATVALATRVMELHGHSPAARFLITNSGRLELTMLRPEEGFDAIHCSGVLHHIPDYRGTMAHFWTWLRPAGEVRLMLYSDEGWRKYAGGEPPDDVAGDPRRDAFVRAFDEVGEWADWYSEARIRERFGDMFELERFEYLCADRRYCAAVLIRRGD